MKTKQGIVVVTGGAGFVGSHLCERLVHEGYQVISLDNYFTGSPANHVEGVEYREGHTKDIAKHITETPSTIYHLGEYARVAPSLDEPEVVWDLNIVGTLGVFAFWREKKCKLVYAGSSTKFVKDGGDIEGRDRAPYNWAKAVNSELVHNYGRWYNLSYAVAYFYNVYGPRERAGQYEGAYGTIVETFKQCAQRHEPCTINGTGEQTRAFTHVYDTVDALIRIGERGEADEYPISAKEVHSLLELARMFELEINFEPATKSTRSSGAEDTTKLTALGWKQQHTLKEYINTCKLLK